MTGKNQREENWRQSKKTIKNQGSRLRRAKGSDTKAAKLSKGVELILPRGEYKRNMDWIPANYSPRHLKKYNILQGNQCLNP
jgi:hypothetical protein